LARGSWFFWFYAGGRSGAEGGDNGAWDIRPIYRSLTAAYGWTYAEIDSHTLAEVNELFEGWRDYPPTNLLVKALVEGFGGKAATAESKTPSADIPPAAMAAMQNSALAQIQVKAGPTLPVVRGRDPGLPKTPPIFDPEVLRAKNSALRLRLQIKA